MDNNLSESCCFILVEMGYGWGWVQIKEAENKTYIVGAAGSHWDRERSCTDVVHLYSHYDYK